MGKATASCCPVGIMLPLSEVKRTEFWVMARMNLIEFQALRQSRGGLPVLALEGDGHFTSNAVGPAVGPPPSTVLVVVTELFEETSILRATSFMPVEPVNVPALLTAT